MHGTAEKGWFWKVFSDDNIPIIEDCGLSHTSGTSYIDYHTLDDVSNNNVSKGIDSYGREFIILVCEVEGIKTPIMTTIFKRFNTTDSYWMSSGHATTKLINTFGGMSTMQRDFIEDIIGGSEIELHSGLYPGSEDWIGKKVKLWKY